MGWLWVEFKSKQLCWPFVNSEEIEGTGGSVRTFRFFAQIEEATRSWAEFTSEQAFWLFAQLKKVAWSMEEFESEQTCWSFAQLKEMERLWVEFKSKQACWCCAQLKEMEWFLAECMIRLIEGSKISKLTGLIIESGFHARVNPTESLFKLLWLSKLKLSGEKARCKKQSGSKACVSEKPREPPEFHQIQTLISDLWDLGEL